MSEVEKDLIAKFMNDSDDETSESPLKSASDTVTLELPPSEPVTAPSAAAGHEQAPLVEPQQAQVVRKSM